MCRKKYRKRKGERRSIERNTINNAYASRIVVG